jgi:predicted nucleotide-binding protein
MLNSTLVLHVWRLYSWTMLKKPTNRPRLFIGSSAESLEFAYAIQQNLEDYAEATVWKQGVFELTKNAVESLVKALDRSDFAVFVFAPNDTVRLRQKNYRAVETTSCSSLASSWANSDAKEPLL